MGFFYGGQREWHGEDLDCGMAVGEAEDVLEEAGEIAELLLVLVLALDLARVLDEARGVIAKSFILLSEGENALSLIHI